MTDVNLLPGNDENILCRIGGICVSSIHTRVIGHKEPFKIRVDIEAYGFLFLHITYPQECEIGYKIQIDCIVEFKF